MFNGICLRLYPRWRSVAEVIAAASVMGGGVLILGGAAIEIE